MDRKMSVRALVVLASLTATAQVALAGPMTPPPGVPSGTMKPLSEVEPRIAINATNTPGDADSVFRISQPGSYYLTGEVLGAPGMAGIEIVATSVTLDLSGMTVKGVAGSLSGIRVLGSNVEVRNGTVSNWTGDGIAMESGNYSIVRNVRANANGGVGVLLGAYCSVFDSECNSNGSHGIRLYSLGVASGCHAVYNGGHGIFVANSANKVADCVTTYNDLDGIRADYQTTITGCMSGYNKQNGYSLGYSMISDSMATSNTLSGFELDNSTMATSCNAIANGQNGFWLLKWSSALESSAVANGGAHPTLDAGFYVGGASARITSCHAAGNSRGFYVASNMNAFLAMNSASGNTNAQFVINTVNDTGAVIANPGTGFTSTNPFANIAP